MHKRDEKCIQNYNTVNPEKAALDDNNIKADFRESTGCT
jgi:hypothetical protein